jgi:hypothetical protein
MSALHRAHLGAWASRRDLGFCSGVTYVPLGIQALKPFLVCSELRPDQRHRHPHRPQSLVGRTVSPRAAECSLLPALAWSGKASQERTARGCGGAGEASRLSDGSPEPHGS